MTRGASLGASYLGEGRCAFRVWAPLAETISVHLVAPGEALVSLKKDEKGYFYGEAPAGPGALYYYLLDERVERPDPASRFQPSGVHGPSRVVDPHSFTWMERCWHGLSREKLVFYELHVGTFTRGGTFSDIIPHLSELQELGVNTIELMPVAQFPGSRNWGYDGVYPFAVQDSYGGPDGLKTLVDACHGQGLAVFLDVVYNHLGPEGNYLEDYGPYFTDRYRTPWGKALNFDGPDSDGVRRFFIENALYWVTDFHLDGLRLDAVHAITDKSARPFLEELAAAVHRQGEQLGRRVYVIAESDLNDPRLIKPAAVGGDGLDAQWSDDFHHSLHSLVTGERSGYYQDFGLVKDLAQAFKQGYTYAGQYSGYRKRRHGKKPVLCSATQFVVFAQNHDHVGNRAQGERLGSLVSLEGLMLAAGVMLTSPFLPLLFMGEEYAEPAPFQYFTSHSEPALVEAVRQGRREEFSGFTWAGEVPDPQGESTFWRSKLSHDLARQGNHGVLRKFYRELLRLRRETPALAELSMDAQEVTACEREKVLFVHRWSGVSEVCLVFSFNDSETAVELPVPSGSWLKLLDAAQEQWLGPGSTAPDLLISDGRCKITLQPCACVLYELLREE